MSLVSFRKLSGCAAALILGAWAAAAQGQDYPFCQHLDRDDQPAWKMYLGSIVSGEPDKPNSDHFNTLELGAGLDARYYRTAAGDFGIGASFDADIFSNRGGVELPSQVGVLKADLTYIRRMVNGFAAMVEFEPGLYSDLEKIEGEDFFFPFGLYAIQAFNPNLSMIAGAKIYPGFNHTWDPRLGFRWVFSENWLLDAAYPESRISYWASRSSKFYARYQVNREQEYRLGKRDQGTMLRMYDQRAGGGYDYELADGVHLFVEAGAVFARSISYDENPAAVDIGGGVDVSASPYAQGGLMGSF